MIRRISFRPSQKNTLRGFADLELTRVGLVLHDCTWHPHPNGREWISFPAREWIAQDGTKKYADLGGFDHRDDALWFQRAALDGIHQIAGREGRQ